MNIHRLKTWPEHFRAVKSGQKKAELRLNDREFETGDLLILEEYEPSTKEYSGELCVVRITHILGDEFRGLEDGYCMLSFRFLA